MPSTLLAGKIQVQDVSVPEELISLFTAFRASCPPPAEGAMQRSQHRSPPVPGLLCNESERASKVEGAMSLNSYTLSPYLFCK